MRRNVEHAHISALVPRDIDSWQYSLQCVLECVLAVRWIYIYEEFLEILNKQSRKISFLQNKTLLKKKQIKIKQERKSKSQHPC